MNPQSSASALPATRIRYSVLAMLCFLAMITYMDRAMYGSAKDDMMASVGQPRESFFFLLVAFQIAYAIFEVPTGWMGDTFGPRATLLRIVLWWSLFIALTAFAGMTVPGTEFVLIGFTVLVVVQFLFGMGEAGAFPNITRALYNWFPASQRGSAQGMIWLSARFMGGLTPMVWVLLTARDSNGNAQFVGLDWREALWFFAGLAAIWCVVFWWWFRNKPEEHPATNQAERDLIHVGGDGHAGHSGVPWGKILRSRNLLFICLMYVVTNFNWYYLMYYFAGDLKRQFQTFQISESSLHKLAGLRAGDKTVVPPEIVEKLRPMVGPQEVSAAELKEKLLTALTVAERDQYLPRIYDTSIAPSSSTKGNKLLIALIGGSPLLIGMLGCIIGGMLTDRYVRRTGDRKWGRRIYAMIGYGMAGVCYLLATFLIGNFWAFGVCVMLVGFFNDLIMGAAWATCQDIGRRYAAIVAGCMNMIGNLGAAVGNLITGLILQHYSNDPTVGVTTCFTMYAIVYGIGVFLWLKIDASKPIVADENSPRTA
jgi:MFS family permease